MSGSVMYRGITFFVWAFCRLKRERESLVQDSHCYRQVCASNVFPLTHYIICRFCVYWSISSSHWSKHVSQQCQPDYLHDFGKRQRAQRRGERHQVQENFKHVSKELARKSFTTCRKRWWERAREESGAEAPHGAMLYSCMIQEYNQSQAIL